MQNFIRKTKRNALRLVALKKRFQNQELLSCPPLLQRNIIIIQTSICQIYIDIEPGISMPLMYLAHEYLHYPRGWLRNYFRLFSVGPGKGKQRKYQAHAADMIASAQEALHRVSVPYILPGTGSCRFIRNFHAHFV